MQDDASDEADDDDIGEEDSSDRFRSRMLAYRFNFLFNTKRKIEAVHYGISIDILDIIEYYKDKNRGEFVFILLKRLLNVCKIMMNLLI